MEFKNQDFETWAYQHNLSDRCKTTLVMNEYSTKKRLAELTKEHLSNMGLSPEDQRGVLRGTEQIKRELFLERPATLDSKGECHTMQKPCDSFHTFKSSQKASKPDTSQLGENGNYYNKPTDMLAIRQGSPWTNPQENWGQSMKKMELHNETEASSGNQQIDPRFNFEEWVTKNDLQSIAPKLQEEQLVEENILKALTEADLSGLRIAIGAKIKLRSAIENLKLEDTAGLKINAKAKMTVGKMTLKIELVDPEQMRRLQSIPGELFEEELTKVEQLFIPDTDLEKIKPWLVELKRSLAVRNYLRTSAECSSFGPGSNLDVDELISPKIGSDSGLLMNAKSNMSTEFELDGHMEPEENLESKMGGLSPGFRFHEENQQNKPLVINPPLPESISVYARGTFGSSDSDPNYSGPMLGDNREIKEKIKTLRDKSPEDTKGNVGETKAIMDSGSRYLLQQPGSHHTRDFLQNANKARAEGSAVTSGNMELSKRVKMRNLDKKAEQLYNFNFDQWVQYYKLGHIQYKLLDEEFSDVPALIHMDQSDLEHLRLNREDQESLTRAVQDLKKAIYGD